MKSFTSRSLLLIALGSIALTQLYSDVKCKDKPLLDALHDNTISYLYQKTAPYFQNPFAQNTYGIVSNLCQIGSMCGSALVWGLNKSIAGTYWTTELIKNNPKIAASLALYTAWYMGQKRWAQDAINKAQEFLNAKIEPLASFSKWRTGQYHNIHSIMSNLNQAGTDLLTDYDRFATNSFCTCLKNAAGNDQNKKTLAIKLALEMEYKTSKEILELFTEGRNIWLTNVSYWIEQYLSEHNINLNNEEDTFDLYKHAQHNENLFTDLNNYINPKIASTGLPTTRFVSEQPSAYWNWMRYVPLSIPLGFIWPYERQASELYWKLFNYNQRVAALHSAILEYIRAHQQADGNAAAYGLNQFNEINHAINQFLGNSSKCNAQYCIKKLQAQQ